MPIHVEILSGACAGVFGTVLGFPFDTVKTRMQTHPQRYKSMSQSFINIFREEGLVKGFYRGIAPPLTALTILNMMNFTMYAKLCLWMNVQKDRRVLEHVEPRVIVAGALSGLAAAIVSTPFELVKIQMQLESLSSSFKGKNSFGAAREIYSRYGIAHLYRGHGINTSREMCFLGTYFFIYEHSKHILQPWLPISLAVAISGGMSGAIGWFVSFPLDCVKANIQGASISSKPQSALLVANKLISTKGIYGLYSGVGASVARAFLVSSSRFMAYEFTQWALS